MPSLALHKLYNPHRMPKEAIVENFVIRTKPFEKIVNDVKNYTVKKSNQHFIIQGQRGSGKSTLLLRLKYEIDTLEEKIAVIFDEEEYVITTLEEMWERVWEILQEDGYFTEEKEHSYKNLSRCLKKSEQILIMLIDNIGDILDNFDDDNDEHVLREILQTDKRFKIIGGSPYALETYYSYDKPFYDFFNVITLKGLDLKATITYLKQLAIYYKQENVEYIIENNLKRVEILRELTAGNPRTLGILFEIFSNDKDGTVFQDMEKLLDDVTGLYKHRMEEMSKQHRKIVSLIAQNWEAISVKELAVKAKMQSNLLSAQLKKLERNDVVEVIKTSTKNNLYRVKERFFNIWYLMRYKKRNADKIRWLIEFMDIWYSDEMLKDRIENHKESLKSGNYIISESVKLTEALGRISWKRFGTNEAMLELFFENIDYLKNNGKYDEYGKDLSLGNEFFYVKKIKKYIDYSDYKSAELIIEEALGKNIPKNYFYRILPMIYSKTKNIKFFNSLEYFFNEYSVDIKNDVMYFYFMSIYISYHKINGTEFRVKFNTNLDCSKINLDGYFNLVIYLLYYNYIDLAIDLLNNFLSKKNTSSYRIDGILFVLLAKKQFNRLGELFEKYNFLKEEYREVYFAFIKLIDDRDEYLRVPPEVEEAVGTIIENISLINTELDKKILELETSFKEYYKTFK